jgi:hypothetical protein
MKKVLPMIAVVALACDSSSEPGATIADLDIEVEASAATVAAGDTVEITITATNPTSRTIAMPSWDCMPLGYEVHSPEDERVAPPEEDHCAVVEETTWSNVPPNQSRSVTHIWVAIEDYGVEGGSGAPLPAGEYSIIGLIDGAPASAPRDTITIVVTDPN